TCFDLGVTKEELNLLEKLKKKSEETSEYGCMPTLSYEKYVYPIQETQRIVIIGSDFTSAKAHLDYLVYNIPTSEEILYRSNSSVATATRYITAISQDNVEYLRSLNTGADFQIHLDVYI